MQKKYPARVTFVVFTSVPLALLVAGLALWMQEPTAEQISHGLEGTVIPHLKFEKVSGNEAIAFVLDRVHHEHPELRKVRVSLASSSLLPFRAPSHDPLSNVVTLDLREIPASESLRYITGLCDCNYTVRDGRIYVYGFDLRRVPPLTFKERLGDYSQKWYQYLLESRHP